MLWHWFCYLVDHGYDGDGEVDLQAVDDGHPKAAQDGEDKEHDVVQRHDVQW